MSHVSIMSFDPRDETALGILLQMTDLSGEDITPEMLEHFLVAHTDHGIVGAAGLEVLGETGLLRSVAVDEAHRGMGLGKQLVERMEDHAREVGVRELYLLTTTAEAFFTGLGYVKIPRERAPAGIAGTEQFSSLCPSSSCFMAKTLAQ
ncbi:MAG TPA: arsenic resistance N-acetyltransferase ArsN2 [Gammaproteobacteria bacterium]|jgi:amino-acid N-acetyltransferase